VGEATRKARVIFFLDIALWYYYNKVMNRKRAKLEAKRKKLVKQLLDLDPWIQGTVVETKRTCGSKGCACRHGGPKHPAMSLTWKEKGKTQCLYVPRQLKSEVKLWAQNYRRLKMTMEKITKVQRDIIRLREKGSGRK
jgi:hypothetical protein